MGRSASRSREGSGKGEKGDSKREKGTVNTWNNDRQFGFVSCDSGRQDLFTHAEYITDTNARYDAKTRGLRRGDRIAFDVEEPQGNKKSMQAVNVEILDLVKRSRSPSRRRSRSRGRGGGGRGRSRSRGRNTRPMDQRDSGRPSDGNSGGKPRARSDSRKAPPKRRDSRRRSPPPRRRDSRSNSRRRRSP
ncbi:unnamed protein product [Cladocopium goreaui]|uniref:Cold shock-like protein CspD (CSP-D) n=1 Tax=Cladocopium goreaui TaxID=2562237 RepID=A0A9P1DUV4_9DINO|nr:unnamed protein product [Cladocopium goreaui]